MCVKVPFLHTVDIEGYDLEPEDLTIACTQVDKGTT